MDFYQLASERKEEIIDKTKELLRIPSVLQQFNPDSETPFGSDINKALHFMLDMAKEDGFVTKNIANYAGHIEYGSGKEIVGVLCHLDVVPAGDGWSNPPFDPIVKDEKLFARGASDDKGPTMAAYFALKFMKELGIEPTKRIRIIVGTDEETKWRGIEKYFQTEEMPTVGFAPDAMFPLIYAEKGFYSFDITGKTKDQSLITFKAGDRYNVVPDYAECTLRVDLKEQFEAYLSFNGLAGEVKDNTYMVYGKRAHAMQPNLGINAAFILAQFLQEHIDNDFIKYINEYLTFDHLGEKYNIDHFDEEMKEFTMNPAIFEYENKSFRIGVNCRYPKGWDKDSAKINLLASIHKYHFKLNVVADKEIHYVDKNDPLVQTLHQSYIKYTGDTTTPLLTIGGGTYSRALTKAVAFGPAMPGSKDVAHQVDEYIPIEDLVKGVAIYMDALVALTK